MQVTLLKCDQGTYVGVCFSDCVFKLEEEGHSVLTGARFKRMSMEDYLNAANDPIADHPSDSFKFAEGLQRRLSLVKPATTKGSS